MMKSEAPTAATRVWLVLAKCYGSMAEFVEKSISGEEGLCLSDFMVLEVLLHKGPLTMSAIAKKVLLANASMTSAIDRLDQRGMVIRKSSDEDRRIRVAELTPAGRKWITEVFARHEQQLEVLMADLSLSERAQLYRGLKKLGLAAESAAAAEKQESAMVK
jgi:MarR family transcriptional regulator, 2-MHQ and catechol-resistance regulon repressor